MVIFTISIVPYIIAQNLWFFNRIFINFIKIFKKIRLQLSDSCVLIGVNAEKTP